MSKSVGKFVLFRTEDFLDIGGNIINSYADSNKPLEDWPTNKKNAILRSQTYNYKIIDGDLNTEPAFNSMTSIASNLAPTPEGQDSIKFNYKKPQFTSLGFPDWYEKFVNFDPYDAVNNPKGINVASEHFLNHNLSVSRPLITTEGKQQGFHKVGSAGKFGLDDELTIAPVYNFYLKEYENFFLNNPKLENGTLASEKAIPNFYHTLFLLNSFQTGATSYGGFLPSDTVSGLLKGIVDFLEWSPQKAFSKIYSDELELLTEQNSVIVLTSDFYKTHNSLINSQKKVYPLYNVITVPTVKNETAIRELFKTFKLYDNLQYATAAYLKILHKLPESLKEDNSDLLPHYDMYKLSVSNLKAKQENGDSMGFETSPKIAWSKVNAGDGKIYEFSPFTAGKWLKKDADTGFEGTALNLESWSVPTPDESLNLFKIPYVNPKISFKDQYNWQRFWSRAQGFLGLRWTPVGLANFPIPKTKKIDEMIPDLSGHLIPMVFHGDQKGNNKYVVGAVTDKTQGILEKLIKIVKVNAASVLKNKQNYSEVLFYEIVKYGSEPGPDSVPIQTFLIPNEVDLETTEYIDSQIKYGKEYFYKIYAHTISIGNKLKRSGTAPTANLDEYWLYENQYDVKILRIPYYNFSKIEGVAESQLGTTNLDAPPMPPNISFFPYKNVSDKIGFWFNTQMGSAFMIPEYSLLTEEQRILIQKSSVSKLGTKTGALHYTSDTDFLNKPIFYKTDDYGGRFEVFRLKERPEKYSDFLNAKIGIVDVIGAKTFVDDVEPNQNYYYIFRSIDVHGLPSNPSPVYHLKMITHNDIPESDSVHVGTSGGQPVLFNEIIYLDDNYEKKIDNKSFKKYLLVEPSLRQTFLNFDNFDTEGGINKTNDVLSGGKELNFGNAEEKLFDKKFKLRITSKQTGRKLDVNVHFKSPKIYKAEEDD